MRKLLGLLPILIIFLVACGGDNNSPEKEKEKEISPSLFLDKISLSVTENSAQLTINYNYATSCLYILIKKGDIKPSINDVLLNGKSVLKSPHTLILSDLLENTTYELYVAVKGNGGEVMNFIEFTTLKAEQQLISNHTMVLYMMGNNTGLETSMDANLNKVKEVAKRVLLNNNHIMVFYDRGNYTQLSEIVIEDGRTKQTLVKEYNSSAISSVDVSFMQNVFEFIKERTKSDSYGLILSSHGGGWIPSDMFDIYMESMSATNRIANNTSKKALNEISKPITKFFGQDGTDYMEIPDLSKALSNFHTDYIIFDACFMASIEALYDLRKIQTILLLLQLRF
jgi:Clostripain family.